MTCPSQASSMRRHLKPTLLAQVVRRRRADATAKKQSAISFLPGERGHGEGVRPRAPEPARQTENMLALPVGGDADPPAQEPTFLIQVIRQRWVDDRDNSRRGVIGGNLGTLPENRAKAPSPLRYAGALQDGIVGRTV